MTTDPMSWIVDALESLERQTLRRRLVVRDGPQRPGSVVIDGREMVHFGSNDYLGLADDDRVADAVVVAVRQHGWGSGASPLVAGRSRLHARLEAELAQFENARAALLFGSGYAANVGAVTALVGPGDTVFSDALNHASIIDGCRLSGATVRVYPHGDVDTLADMLERARAGARRLIVTDGLFSMEGDVAPLAALAGLAKRHGAMLMVDEAHATGVLGDRGRGASEMAGVDELVDVRVGTLSKALGSIGGFVAGSSHLVEWLANRARPYVFSTAMPAAACAAGIEALRIVRDEPDRRTGVLDRAQRLRSQLHKAGFDVGRSVSQIVPIVVGSADRAMRLSMALRKSGLFVPAIRPPSVPEGRSLLRVSLSHGHTDEMIDRLVGELTQGKT